MPPKKKQKVNTVSPPTDSKASGKKTTKVRFGRSLDQRTPSPENITTVRQRPPFIPQSPPRALIRSLCRTLKKPTCSLFGPHREMLYSDYFFCANCKSYDDYASSGYARRIGRDSARFRCTANHADFFFPTDRLIEANSSTSRGGTSIVSRCSSKACSSYNSDESIEDSSSEDFLDDEKIPARASHEFEATLREKLKEQEETFNAVIRRLQDELSCKSAVVDELTEKAEILQEEVAEHVEKIIELTRKNNQLNNNLNYYKKQAAERKAEVQSLSLPLDEAVVKVLNDLLVSRGRYKLMKRSNVAAAVAKGVFHPSFGNGIVLPEIIKLSKNWLRKNVFTPSEILKQMDIRGGTLNYEGLSVLNDVETAAECSEGVGRMGRLLPSPASLQRVAQKLEKEGENLCPFELIKTDFGEGVEFDYAKTTRLVIDAFGLAEVGKERPINVSASIDAAKLTKNITHTSAGLKMTDVQGRDPFKNKRSFITDENSLRDLQSRNTIFC